MSSRKLVDEHGADARVRKLSSKTQLVALLYAQLAGAVSLREIETAMRATRRGSTTWARARFRARPWPTPTPCGRMRCFSGLFASMVGRASRGLRRSTAEAVRLIDSTSCGWPGSPASGRASPRASAGPRRTSSTIPTPNGRSTWRSPRPR